MDYQSRRYFSHFSNKSSDTVLISDFEHNWSNMYAQPNDGKNHNAQIISQDKHSNFGIFATKQVENMQDQPKTDNMLQSIYKKVTSHLTANVNTPLSVTLVSPDLLKSFHQPLGVEQSQNVQYTWCDSHNSYGCDEPLSCIPTVLNTGHNHSDSDKKNDLGDYNDSEKRWRDYKNMYIDCTKTNKEDLEQVDSDKNYYNKDNSLLESQFTVIESHCNKELDISTNFGNILKVEDDPVILDKPSTSPTTPSKAKETVLSPVSTLFTNCNKMVNGFVNGVSELFRAAYQTEEANNESLFLKRSVTSPKSRRKRVVSKRIRGRAKPQLRKSGVSQTRHRKLQNVEEQRRCELDSWDEVESSESEKDYDEVDCAIINHKFTFTLADVPTAIAKPKKTKTPYTEVSVSIKNIENQVFAKEKVRIRPRSISESSIDSEDSYCIVFEGTEYDDYSESEEETETDNDEEFSPDHLKVQPEETPRKSKVRFNLKPVVHQMIKWNFAYRAARTGPWERFARDRERFKRHIDNVGKVISPILEDQHRVRIYQERFNMTS